MSFDEYWADRMKGVLRCGACGVLTSLENHVSYSVYYRQWLCRMCRDVAEAIRQKLST